MRNCLWNCVRDLLKWVVPGAVIAGVVAYFLGVNLAIGGVIIAALLPGINAALAALGFVLFVGFVVSLGWCYVRCQRQFG